MFGYSMVSVAFTAFAVGGIANAINIIDGFNGLAAGTVIIILSGFVVIFLSVKFSDLAYPCILFTCAMIGFLLHRSSIQCSRTICAMNSKVRLFLCILRKPYITI